MKRDLQTRRWGHNLFFVATVAMTVSAFLRLMCLRFCLLWHSDSDLLDYFCFDQEAQMFQWLSSSISSGPKNLQMSTLKPSPPLCRSLTVSRSWWIGMFVHVSNSSWGDLIFALLPRILGFRQWPEVLNHQSWLVISVSLRHTLPGSVLIHSWPLLTNFESEHLLLDQ